jgi:drug/metabolite transporter (DMT)-like permease
LININPVLAAILGSLVLHERLSFAGWAGIGISFAGAVIIATTRSGAGLSFSPGAAAILAAAFCFALQWILQKPLLARHRPLAVATWVIWLGTILLLPFLGSALRDLPSAPAGAIGAAVFLGLGPAALAYAVWAYALAHYPVGRATSFLYLVAPVTLVMAYFLLGEIPLPATIMGGALTLFGVIVVNSWGKAPPAIASAELAPSVETP